MIHRASAADTAIHHVRRLIPKAFKARLRHRGRYETLLWEQRLPIHAIEVVVRHDDIRALRAPYQGEPRYGSCTKRSFAGS